MALCQHTEPAFDSVLRRGGPRGVHSRRMEDFGEPVSWVVREQKRKPSSSILSKPLFVVFSFP